MKKLINYLRWKLAQWHKKRFQKLMAKSLGANRYYKYAKSNLNSLYGKQVTDFVNAYKSGNTHADMTSAYPNVMREGIYPNIYANERDLNILASGIVYANTDSLVNQEGTKNEM